MHIDLRHKKTICLNCFATLDKIGFCSHCNSRSNDVNGSVMSLPLRTLLKERYLISRPLGVGGFGITYLAWDMQTSQRVAIKEFFPKGYTTRSSRSTAVTVLQPNFLSAFNHWLEAFVQEAKTLTQIKHLHGVVKLLDFFQSNNTAYIVMDYLEGASIRQYLNMRGGKIPLQESLNIMRPVMDSLLLLHQYGIIHKDISPENIIVVQNRYVKLIDFGASTFFNHSILKPYIVLKAGYSPLEFYNTHLPQGPWSDIYQVAATLYNCITGVIPPESPQRANCDTIIRPSSFGVQLPLVVENCLMRSLSVDPMARYDNIGKYIQILYGEFMPKPLSYPRSGEMPRN